MHSNTHIFTNDVITVAALKERLGWTSRWREVAYVRATDLGALTRHYGAVEIRFRDPRRKKRAPLHARHR